jgi:tartrate dehydratase beta subunit/fumarate hydratase class I family protein
MKEQEVLILITKAAETEKADDALKFSQAACNAANALCALASAKTIKSAKDSRWVQEP